MGRRIALPVIAIAVLYALAPPTEPTVWMMVVLLTALAFMLSAVWRNDGSLPDWRLLRVSAGLAVLGIVLTGAIFRALPTPRPAVLLWMITATEAAALAGALTLALG